MAKSFANEDNRKTKLFYAWNNYLRIVRVKFQLETKEAQCFDEIWEGLSNVANISENSLELTFEDKSKIKNLSVNPQVINLSYKGDTIYLIAGRLGKDWWPLEVVSVGSIINEAQGGFHFTINPELMRLG
jgi:hypothetical protein